MERRTFLKASGLGLLAMATQARPEDADSSQKPNILIIMTDQQFADAMSCAMGSEYIHTPHMDSLAENGMRFTRAYSPNPLCMPMRTSMFTGRYPHQTGAQTNGAPKLNPADFVFMGDLFKDSGYETGYFGKWHIAFDSKRKEVHGFETLEEKNSRSDPARSPLPCSGILSRTPRDLSVGAQAEDSWNATCRSTAASKAPAAQGKL